MVNRLNVLLIILGLYSSAVSAEEPAQLVVHEWGTITTHHYQNGHQEGGLNKIRSEEELPSFVHRLDMEFLKSFDKGGNVAGHPDVRMRLETPVIYFYPDSSYDVQTAIDVDVEFRGGLLNEYYPKAESNFENIKDPKGNVEMSQATISRLSWKNVKFPGSNEVPLGGSWMGPATDSKVWLSPRKTHSTQIYSNGESEKYLFYRGVANLNSLLDTAHNSHTKKIQIRSSGTWPLPDDQQSLLLPKLWIIHIKKDKTAAFKTSNDWMVPSKLASTAEEAQSSKPLAEFDMDIPESGYSAENLIKLRLEMRTALIEAGLFEDEADAMLNTWEESYFHSPGSRILYIVPREWSDTHLPLKFSQPVNLTRVYIGRVDLLYFITD